MGSCCGRSPAKATAGSRRTEYVVTWGDGSKGTFATLPAARVAMAQERDAAKRRGMSVLSRQVTV